MKIKSLRNIIASLLFFFLILFCKGQSNLECLTTLEEKLSPKVNVENKIGEIINLRDNVNCFDWDSLIVISAIYLNEKAEKDLGIKLPLEHDYSWGSENAAILLFVKDNIVVNHVFQQPTVDRKNFNSAKSLKAYYFLNLLKNYGNDSYYTIIPKEKAVFETYPIIYHENGKEKSNPKYGLGVKVKED